ncbi:uncharacterized protein L969DRAFT_48429 [Mixia osmundae IAM 14324]|uniref:uncharacterized protein n=1 Tax=Mixia osmundae (strain CBS 9802 / IAM 14324 / JCM 22182 / KY 12970) TaxID=764103 RepID=UPI0004A552AB|nr:uncharacterized protein L969DRAFT_48429 [Mixia osmundae IAM 14324]KEI40388.1 hypothetical protein L969DRAFT_48429 [Mixia osmundae IAM 14324]
MADLKAIIAPSVLASDFGALTHECTRIMKDGADWLHMGELAIASTHVGPPILKSVHASVEGAFMDCHMMVADPIRWVKDVAEAGGKSYTFHLEATGSERALDCVKAIKQHGMRAAMAISPNTPSSAIEDRVGRELDMILVMTVEPGKGGQSFMQNCVSKVADLRARFPSTDIEVDGGVGPKTVKVCADSGANVIVSGTACFGAPVPSEAIAQMRQAVEDGKKNWPKAKQ